MYTCDSTGTKQLIQIPSTNITTTRSTTELHEIETNLQFGVQIGPLVNLLNKIKTALAKLTK